jgi:hypothetical protein
MSAEFFASFVRRFGCTVDVLSGREFDGNGRRAEQGGSCEACGVCSRPYGDVGVAAEGFVLENSVSSGLQLRWVCPGCGSDVYEDTDLLGAAARASVSKADPLCFICRRKAAAK